MPLTIEDFHTPTEHPFNLLSGHRHAMEMEQTLAFLLTRALESGSLLTAIPTRIGHPELTRLGLAEMAGPQCYRLTPKALGLLYTVYGRKEKS